ncbi:ATP-dependent RecD-like DNA helicase [Sphingosinithalassobacter sp. CS137]|uniref:ATP-dependent DNA helicase n=1 Tax=Sphingosinithalassobacter sp. CS137 TaxID=2762748 RepID=UPI00165E442E|nr:ATP-dependent RecD-like DNA helicase [Sphingosinithalassobacter sp. CS137]
MKGANARHLSVRVPWHDGGWDGTICRNPKANTACLAVSLIAEGKNDEFEQCHAGEAFENLEPSRLPPCVRERSAFLSGRAQPLSIQMPYSSWSDLHRHIRPTTVQLPAWGGVVVPYRWMLREPAEQLAKDLGLDLDLDREPQSPDFPGFMSKTAWIQEVENQRTMLEAFADPLEPETSLVFFYARRTPLADGLGSPIVAVARVEHVGKVDEYPYAGGAAGGRVRSMIWERPFQHSLRRGEHGFSGGVVLPYQEILSLAESNSEIEPAQYLALAPEELREQFLYGSEHVEHGSAIAALQSVRNALERIETIIPGRWAEAIDWIDARISELWTLRGPAPGLGSALSCVQPNAFNGTLFAHALAPFLDEGANPWPVVEEIFAGVRPPPAGAPALTGMQRKRCEHIRMKEPSRYRLMQTLSRFELSRDQAFEAWDAERTEDYVRNPYELFQRSRFTLAPIGLGTVDRGIQAGGPIREAWPLPDECEVNPLEPDDWHRLLAASIAALEGAAAAGSTLVPAKVLAERVAELPLSPTAPIDELTLELLADEFNPEVDVSELDGEWYAQLERYVETRLVIGRAIKARLSGGLDTTDAGWRELLDAALDGGLTEERRKAARSDELEHAARQEKAEALATLASSRVAVLLGPAGSGKTTLLKVLLGRRSIVGNDVALLAPTGKARVRLGVQTGMPNAARTLAQFLLEQQRWDPDTGVHCFPRTGPTARISTCIVDEASMLTEDQFAALVSALPTTARLILVGDPKQLPPIGAGRPFVDLIAHLEETAGGVGVARLRISRRQTGVDGSVAADALEDVQLAALFAGAADGPGEDEIAGLPSGDRLRLLEWDTSDRLRQCVAEALETELDCTAGDLERAVEISLGGTEDEFPYFNVGAGAAAERWQILTPHRDLPGGSADLNRHVKRVARSRRLDSVRDRERQFKMIEPRGSDEITYGDKVICLRNHGRKRWDWAEGEAHDGYLANGEVGVVVGQAGYKYPRFTQIEFATQLGDTYSFSRRDFSDHASPLLELGYAVTVHKAQGSEFGTTLLVLPRHSRLLTRELLYTALTRQKDRIWILHQGPFGGFLRFRSEYHSETARRVTNLFASPRPVAIEPPPGEPAHARRTFLEDKLIHATRRGDLVSSKSEIVIADILHELEQRGLLRYTFEKPRLLGGIERWPDFTIEVGADIWYWEHCGMLERPSYRRRWERKLEGYAAEGITVWSTENPDGRLVVTKDGPVEGLDSGSLHQLAEGLWGSQ